MAYATFDDGEIHFFVTNEGTFFCDDCGLSNGCWTASTRTEALNHLLKHKIAGHKFPESALDRLKTELEMSGDQPRVVEGAADPDGDQDLNTSHFYDINVEEAMQAIENLTAEQFQAEFGGMTREEFDVEPADAKRRILMIRRFFESEDYLQGLTHREFYLKLRETDPMLAKTYPWPHGKCECCEEGCRCEKSGPVAYAVTNDDGKKTRVCTICISSNTVQEKFGERELLVEPTDPFVPYKLFDAHGAVLIGLDMGLYQIRKEIEKSNEGNTKRF